MTSPSVARAPGAGLRTGCPAPRGRIGTRVAMPVARARSLVAFGLRNIDWPQALFFDCDGVLVDTEKDGHRVSFNAAFKERGLDHEVRGHVPTAVAPVC